MSVQTSQPKDFSEEFLYLGDSSTDFATVLGAAAAVLPNNSATGASFVGHKQTSKFW